MKRLIAGGTGLIGQHLVSHWLSQNIEITVLGRNQDKIQQCFGNTVTPMTWETFLELPLQSLKPYESITNLCGENIAEKRWTPERKQSIIQSRILPTQNIVEKLIALGDQAPRLFNASAVGIYGVQTVTNSKMPPALDENTPIDFDNPHDFLQEIATLWEAATQPAKAHGIHVNNMRFGVVLTTEDGALEKMAFPFRFGLGGKIGTGHQPFSWIHIQDLLSIFDFLQVRADIHGPINCVAPNAVSQAELAKAIANALGKPAIIPTPAVAINMVFGEMGKYLLLEGQHVYPSVLTAHDFHFKYPEIKTALVDLLGA